MTSGGASQVVLVGVWPRVRKIPWRRKWQPTPVFLPGESHGQRNLVGYSLWGSKEPDTTKRLIRWGNWPQTKAVDLLQRAPSPSCLLPLQTSNSPRQPSSWLQELFTFISQYLKKEVISITWDFRILIVSVLCYLRYQQSLPSRQEKRGELGRWKEAAIQGSSQAQAWHSRSQKEFAYPNLLLLLLLSRFSRVQLCATS